ncbi:MAG: acyl-CoA/acyl-ACP dehydrogenase, partial [Actinomycetota bacterium]|nr:acyl-CoA/acyl-ACP dehydrogenase [Actinomycetota bacterium]
MDFAFSEEQDMLRDSARGFLSARFTPEHVAELAESDAGWDRSSWGEMAELGWTGLSVPEDRGGAGFGFIEEAVLFEELGRSLYPGPFLATVGLALPALVSSDVLAEVIAGQMIATLAWAEPGGPHDLGGLDELSTKATGSGGNWALSGEKSSVVAAEAADVAVVAAATVEGTALFLVDLGGAQIKTLGTMDATRRLSTLTFNNSAATLLVDPAETPEVLGRIRLRCLAALALEAVGVAQTALDLAMAYVKERKQFDKPIGAYQAVAHQVA